MSQYQSEQGASTSLNGLPLKSSIGMRLYQLSCCKVIAPIHRVNRYIHLMT